LTRCAEYAKLHCGKGRINNSVFGMNRKMAVASAIAILLSLLVKTCLPYKAECLLIFALCLTT